MTLFRKRLVWCPTGLGWLLLCSVVGGMAAYSWFNVEHFLSRSVLVPPDVLVVEGWIGPDGLRAAAAEFRARPYRYVVTTGGLSQGRGHSRRWSYTVEAAEELESLGLPADRILRAEPEDVKSDRTFACAVAVRRTVSAIHPAVTSLTIQTMGPHARRSRLVFGRAIPAVKSIGVIAWAPDDYATAKWWRSSDRCDDLIKETVGYAVELVAGSHRYATVPHP